jgi:hypothetical protein
MKIISFVRRKSLTIVNAVTEKEEHLRTASHGKCKHCDEEKCTKNCAYPANNNPGHHHAPIALKCNEGEFKNFRFLTDGVLPQSGANSNSKVLSSVEYIHFYTFKIRHCSILLKVTQEIFMHVIKHFIQQMREYQRHEENQKKYTHNKK